MSTLEEKAKTLYRWWNESKTDNKDKLVRLEDAKKQDDILQGKLAKAILRYQDCEHKSGLLKQKLQTLFTEMREQLLKETYHFGRLKKDAVVRWSKILNILADSQNKFEESKE